MVHWTAVTKLPDKIAQNSKGSKPSAILSAKHLLKIFRFIKISSYICFFSKNNLLSHKKPQKSCVKETTSQKPCVTYSEIRSNLASKRCDISNGTAVSPVRLHFSRMRLIKAESLKVASLLIEGELITTRIDCIHN